MNSPPDKPERAQPLGSAVIRHAVIHAAAGRPAGGFSEGGRAAWRLFSKNRSATLGLLILTLFCTTALFAPVLAPHPPKARYEGMWLARPGAIAPPELFHEKLPRFWLGTDEHGRDVLSRILYGARVSLLIGFISVGISLFVGGLSGLVAGYVGGWFDVALMRGVDIMLAFPSILLAILIVAVFPEPGLFHAMVAVGIVGIPSYARLVRASVLAEKERDYVQACYALGARHRRVLFRHILPNIMAPLIVQATLGYATAILDAAGLSFLGLGAQDPEIEWGLMLKNGKDLISTAWWVITFPGLAILLAVLGFNLFGDGLRDYMDPMSQR